jgi:hypothetical protein
MKSVFLGAAIVLITFGVVYSFVALEFVDEISQAESQIDEKSSELIGIWSVPTTTPLPQTPTPPKEIETDNDFCLNCHDKAQTASFHYPEKIKAFEESQGRPVRICTNCHGEPVMPVHFKAIQTEMVKCETCHIRSGGGFEVPQKKDEDLLICQLCHARGNYITIHIDGEILRDAEIDSKWIRNREGLDCTTCHNEELYGGRNILAIHEENAADSGSTRKFEPSTEEKAESVMVEESVLDTEGALLDEPSDIVGNDKSPEGKTGDWNAPKAPTTVVVVE